MVKKSKQAYRNITETAEMLDVKPHVLRFWESKFDCLEPMKRGGGRRFYSPEDIEIINLIKELHYGQGLTIKATSLKIDAQILKAKSDPITQSDSAVGSLIKDHDRKSETISDRKLAILQWEEELEKLEARNIAAIAQIDALIQKQNIHAL